MSTKTESSPAVISTVADFIKALGGTGAAASLFGVLPSAVSNWKRENCLPERRLYKASRIAEERALALHPKLLGEPSDAANGRAA